MKQITEFLLFKGGFRMPTIVNVKSSYYIPIPGIVIPIDKRPYSKIFRGVNGMFEMLHDTIEVVSLFNDIVLLQGRNARVHKKNPNRKFILRNTGMFPMMTYGVVIIAKRGQSGAIVGLNPKEVEMLLGIFHSTPLGSSILI